MNFDWTSEEKAIKEKLARMFDPERLFELETMEEADLPTLKSLILKHVGALPKQVTCSSVLVQAIEKTP